VAVSLRARTSWQHIGFAFAHGCAGTREITLVETGSTLIQPLFSVWATEYMKTHPGVRIITNSTGSDQGIKQAISGAAHIGTSDAYMSEAEIRQNPHIINVAMAISAQTVNYNLTRV
jgi:phosphate transport system substrate-binding protein